MASLPLRRVVTPAAAPHHTVVTPLVVRKQQYYTVGTPVEVRSQSGNDWMIGKVVEAKGQTVVLEYTLPEGCIRKELPVGHPDLRQYVSGPQRSVGWYSVGDGVRVFSESRQLWFRAVVVIIEDPTVVVQFRDPQGKAFRKNLHKGSGNLRPLNVVVNEDLQLARVVTPYEVKYGVHPSFFDFDDSGNMVMNLQGIERGYRVGRPITNDEKRLLVAPSQILLQRMDSSLAQGYPGTQPNAVAPAVINPPIMLERTTSAEAPAVPTRTATISEYMAGAQPQPSVPRTTTL